MNDDLPVTPPEIPEIPVDPPTPPAPVKSASPARAPRPARPAKSAKAPARRKPAAKAPAKKRPVAPARMKKVEPVEEKIVVLFRHGIAEDRGGSKPDDDRSLTAEGHDKMKKISKGLARVFPKADLLMSSPLLRAVQTALWIGKRYGEESCETTDTLRPAVNPSEIIELLRHTKARRAIVVGHEPHLSSTLRALTGVDLDLPKGGCAAVRIRADGKASLAWFLGPGQLRRLGE